MIVKHLNLSFSSSSEWLDIVLDAEKWYFDLCHIIKDEKESNHCCLFHPTAFKM